MRLSPAITILDGVQIATMVVAEAVACAQSPSPKTATRAFTSRILIGRGRIFMKKLVLDIGPEFFEDLGKSVRRALFQQLPGIVLPVALIGVIEIRNRHTR